MVLGREVGCDFTFLAVVINWMQLMTAPGFQTNVRRIRVTPEIAARLRRGENVSADEIARASAQAEEDGSATEIKSAANEWLPESLTTPKKKSKGRRNR